MGQKSSKHEAVQEMHQKFPDMKLNDIMEIYKDFKRQSKGKDVLKKKDFVKVYKAIFGKEAGNFAEHIFDAFDVNGDGRVDFQEFLVGLIVTDNASNVNDKERFITKMRWAFNAYDADKSGTIDRDEMRSLIKATAELMPNFHESFGMSPEQYADNLFDEVDDDGNGEISFNEFMMAAKKNSSLLDVLMPAPQ